jgi:class 3 adenylate cyclase
MDILDLLNLHYERAIGRVHEEEGIVGSIIGDALLAVFGAMNDSPGKSRRALRAAYWIQEVASELRDRMAELRAEIMSRKGGLSAADEVVYRAVLLEVGVGIDGGDVFYGNIGSYERMTTTVIGDNVNSASRLEGLTRIYRVPVICSEFVKDEVGDGEYRFLELDTVQVKGKTKGKRIFWPVEKAGMDGRTAEEFDAFSAGLAHYYLGAWTEAAAAWRGLDLPFIGLFNDRVAGRDAPADWNGVWTMATK